MSEQSIYLAFGPVQDFLAQARRTRDLWVGSYLLSYLAAHALHCAERAGGRIVLPALTANPLFAAVKCQSQPVPPGDRIGSVPHVAEVAAPTSQAVAVARSAAEGWNVAWRWVCEVVGNDIRRRFPSWTSETDRIWGRQVSQLWVPMWVVGDPEAMARRKTLRAFSLEAEEGEKCTCCGSREALHDGEGSRPGVRAFWSRVAVSVGNQEVQPDGAERLCAVCTIKRFLPLVAASAFGWKVPTGFPSTVTMATLPWRLEMLKRGAADPSLRSAIARHVDALKTTGVTPVGALAGFPALNEAARTWGNDASVAQAFLDYDGDWFFPNEVQSPVHGDMEAGRRSVILESLCALYGTATIAGISAPRTSYALLTMDGDHLGKLLRAHAERKEKISAALAAFTGRVLEIVESAQANGRLIYAGGDDVLALLPICTALQTADRLRVAYHEVFAKHVPEIVREPGSPTISAGLVYAHMHAPLRQVVMAARRALDEDAKERAGRDAIGVAVWKRPGVVLQFACPWSLKQKGTAKGDEPSLAADIETVRGGIVHRTYSISFLHRAVDLSQVTRTMAPEDEQRLLVAEYLKSREREATREEAEQHVAVLQRLARAADDGASAILLAAFLEEGE